jgi:hypothetical protein
MLLKITYPACLTGETERAFGTKMNQKRKGRENSVFPAFSCVFHVFFMCFSMGHYISGDKVACTKPS